MIRVRFLSTVPVDELWARDKDSLLRALAQAGDSLGTVQPLADVLAQSGTNGAPPQRVYDPHDPPPRRATHRSFAHLKLRRSEAEQARHWLEDPANLSMLNDEQSKVCDAIFPNGKDAPIFVSNRLVAQSLHMNNQTVARIRGKLMRLMGVWR